MPLHNHPNRPQQPCISILQDDSSYKMAMLFILTTYEAASSLHFCPKDDFSTFP